MAKRLTQEEKDENEERRRISHLREYYRHNFQNGEYDESFLTWIESRLDEMKENSAIVAGI